GSRRRLDRTTLLPASEFLPPEGFSHLRQRMPGSSQLSEELAGDLAHLEQGDLGEAAETWATLLTGGAAADHIPSLAHVILTDADELATIAADLDRQATERRERLVASGELPPDWPLPYDATSTFLALAALGAASGEAIAE